MNRRGFLSSILALGAAPLVPAADVPTATMARGLYGASIARLMAGHQAALNGAYMALVHPSVWADIVSIEARERWRGAWRRYRRERRNGACGEIAPRDVLARFGDPRPDFERGTVQGIKFIQSEGIAQP